MSEREIRAMLRAATDAKILTGWNGFGDFGECDSFLWYGPGVKIDTHSLGDTVAYCLMLRDQGVEPLYRESEPTSL